MAEKNFLICGSLSADSLVSKLRFSILPSKKNSPVVSSETDSLRISGDEIPSKNYKYYIIEKSKSSTKVHETTLISLSTSIKSDSKSDSIALPEKNFQARNSLGQSFGSKKQKNRIKDLEKNRINVESLNDSVDVMNEVIDAVEVDEEVASGPRLIPCNLTATTPAELYPIESIIPPSYLPQIPIKPYLSLKKKQDLQPLFTSELLFNLFYACIRDKKGIKQLQKCGYLQILWKLNSITGGNLRSREKVAAWIGLADENEVVDTAKSSGNDSGSSVFDFVVEKFLEVGENGYQITPRNRDLLLLNIILLTLILHDYEVELAFLSSELKLTQAKVNQLCKELGCRIVQKSDANGVKIPKVVKVVVPPEFPRAKRKRRD
ncbi:DNA-directed RNA polymerase I subunit rpa49 [Nowakowskiella sp. JEL0407]|nr:DNA-directed RNA polymerase I subunit rpa49 [Nowakowskiella sp. JEL0407]